MKLVEFQTVDQVQDEGVNRMWYSAVIAGKQGMTFSCFRSSADVADHKIETLTSIYIFTTNGWQLFMQRKEYFEWAKIARVSGRVYAHRMGVLDFRIEETQDESR